MGRFSTGEETTLACHKDRPRRHGRVGHIDNGQRNTTDGLDGRHNRRAKSAFIVIAPVYIGRGYPLSVLGKGGLLWAAKSRAFRESFSEGPLGLKSKRKRPHAVMCVKGLSSVQQVRREHHLFLGIRSLDGRDYRLSNPFLVAYDVLRICSGSSRSRGRRGRRWPSRWISPSLKPASQSSRYQMTPGEWIRLRVCSIQVFSSWAGYLLLAEAQGAPMTIRFIEHITYRI